MSLHWYANKVFIKDKNILDSYIRNNDKFFAEKTIHVIDERVNGLLDNTDGAIYLDKDRFKDKYGYDVPWLFLSTGGKTVLNIFYNPDYLFDLVECGDNALVDVFRLTAGNCIKQGPMYYNVNDTCDFVYNGRYHFTNWLDYKAWEEDDVYD